jgi:hypothetical protein
VIVRSSWQKKFHTDLAVKIKNKHLLSETILFKQLYAYRGSERTKDNSDVTQCGKYWRSSGPDNFCIGHSWSPATNRQLLLK